jgi:hypothetical protein
VPARPSATATASGPQLVRVAGRVTDVDRRRSLITVTTPENKAWQVTVHQTTQITLADGRRLRAEEVGVADQVEVSGFEATAGSMTLMGATMRVVVSAVPQSPVPARANRVLVLLDGVENLRAPQFGFTGDWVKRLNDTGYAVTTLDPARIAAGNASLNEFALIVIGYPATLSDAALRAVVQSKLPVLNADPRLVQPLGLGLNLDPQQPTRNVAGRTVEVAAGGGPLTRGFGGEITLARETLYRMPIVPNGATLATITDGGRKVAVWSQSGNRMYLGFWWSNNGQNHTDVYWTLFDRSVLALLGSDPAAVPAPPAPAPNATTGR